MTTPTALDLRDVAEADVYLDDDLVAHLVRGQRDTISFDYLPDKHSADARVRDRSVL
ncbi:hypothetical protein [Mycobacterium xenopi]|uniref:hypothetical protein n=1 Tax=Mycobacterium xenopi TaxID=1789 RepID=UPI0002ECEC0D|nr:hypothetical protein [Mycobacterium xenopi]